MAYSLSSLTAVEEVHEREVLLWGTMGALDAAPVDLPRLIGGALMNLGTRRWTEHGRWTERGRGNGAEAQAQLQERSAFRCFQDRIYWVVKVLDLNKLSK